MMSGSTRSLIHLILATDPDIRDAKPLSSSAIHCTTIFRDSANYAIGLRWAPTLVVLGAEQRLLIAGAALIVGKILS